MKQEHEEKPRDVSLGTPKTCQAIDVNDAWNLATDALRVVATQDSLHGMRDQAGHAD